jgi:hypothetical protein
VCLQKGDQNGNEEIASRMEIVCRCNYLAGAFGFIHQLMRPTNRVEIK